MEGQWYIKGVTNQREGQLRKSDHWEFITSSNKIERNCDVGDGGGGVRRAMSHCNGKIEKERDRSEAVTDPTNPNVRGAGPAEPHKPPNVTKDVTMTLRTQDDDSSGDRDVHHTWNLQMASSEAADATNPDATSAGSTAPVGRLH
ncbi:hypothetical protein BU15DRAFT_64265 [Melanogaster broomeanus]|nr:hypothetical protein BU15DRAFT_64265 [Melanogaster broomeanus]